MYVLLSSSFAYFPPHLPPRPPRLDLACPPGQNETVLRWSFRRLPPRARVLAVLLVVSSLLSRRVGVHRCRVAAGVLRGLRRGDGGETFSRVACSV